MSSTKLRLGRSRGGKHTAKRKRVAESQPLAERANVLCADCGTTKASLSCCGVPLCALHVLCTPHAHHKKSWTIIAKALFRQQDVTAQKVRWCPLRGNIHIHTCSVWYVSVQSVACGCRLRQMLSSVVENLEAELAAAQSHASTLAAARGRPTAPSRRLRGATASSNSNTTTDPRLGLGLSPKPNKPPRSNKAGDQKKPRRTSTPTVAEIRARMAERQRQRVAQEQARVASLKRQVAEEEAAAAVAAAAVPTRAQRTTAAGSAVAAGTSISAAASAQRQPTQSPHAATAHVAVPGHTPIDDDRGARAQLGGAGLATPDAPPSGTSTSGTMVSMPNVARRPASSPRREPRPTGTTYRERVCFVCNVPSQSDCWFCCFFVVWPSSLRCVLLVAHAGVLLRVQMASLLVNAMRACDESGARVTDGDGIRPVVNPNALLQLARQVELQLYAIHGDVTQGYREQLDRMLQGLRDAKNSHLRASLIGGEVAPSSFVRFTPLQLANPEYRASLDDQREKCVAGWSVVLHVATTQPLGCGVCLVGWFASTGSWLPCEKTKAE